MAVGPVVSVAVVSVGWMKMRRKTQYRCEASQMAIGFFLWLLYVMFILPFCTTLDPISTICMEDCFFAKCFTDLVQGPRIFTRCIHMSFKSLRCKGLKIKRLGKIFGKIL